MSENDPKVDETITAVSGEWEFDDEVADSFDSHVKKSIPFYDELQRMVCEISEYFVKKGSVVYDLGSSTGETIARLAQVHKNKDGVQLIGYELNDDMIQQANEKVHSEKVRFINKDIKDANFSPAPDFVTSLMTFHFLTLNNRRTVLNRIYESMNEGGALLMVEKIHADNSKFEDMWLELYWDFKKRMDLTSDQILQKAGSIRGVLDPLTIEENLDLLHQAGFEKAETFFQWYNWVGFLATKNQCLNESVTGNANESRRANGNGRNPENPDSTE